VTGCGQRRDGTLTWIKQGVREARRARRQQMLTPAASV